MKDNNYYLITKLLLLFVIKITISNSILNTNIIYNLVSEIHLTIKGNGNQNLLNEKFPYDPSEVLVNGKLKQCNKTCYLDRELNNVTLRFNQEITSCYFMFRDLKNIIELDLSNFDNSKVTTMQSMFHHCESLIKINFGNINTSSVENMISLFDACYKLTSVDLSKFDTSNTKTFELMFWSCRKLKYLDLSNFDTSKITNIRSMFLSCESLIYLNINSFKLDNTVNKNNAFDGISSNVKYCINDTKTINILLDKNKISNCSDDCFKNNIKLDLNNDVCLDSCVKNGYKYEYNNICYKNCPINTYSLLCDENNCDNNTKECFDKTPEGYYLDSDNRIYKRCFDSCKFCYEKGNETNNNCKECKTNYIFLKENETNCYEKCNYYYYFDKQNKYYCTQNETCPILYYKLIKEENKCIDKCENDIIYKYENNNICYIKCPNGTYSLIDNEYLCFEKEPEGYYFDLKEEIYKKCFENCKYCYGNGNKTNNNCKECINNFSFYNNPFNISNCYKICEYYYYFDELFIYHCTENNTCPIEYNKLIENKNKCINNCKNDDLYKYEYNNKCYINCPNETFLNESNFICYKKEKNQFNTFTENLININLTKDEINENIKKYREYISIYNITENMEDFTLIDKDIIYQITTSENQKNNKNKNISTIDLGECEKILKKEYNIDESLPLLILKIDYFSPDSLIPIIGYEIYHPINKSKLDLHYCEEILIKLNIPVSIDENNLFKYDPNSGFYKDNCFAYTTENGTDIILNDRKQEFTDNKLSLCENNCNYTGYDKGNKQSSCDCNIKNKIDLISDIINNQNITYDSLNSEKGSSSSSNIISIKCTNALFSKEGLKNNISSYILIIFIIQFIISFSLFIRCGYPLLIDDIKKILNEKEKKSKNMVESQRTAGDKRRNKKLIHKKSKFNFPPKKYGIHLINNNNLHFFKKKSKNKNDSSSIKKTKSNYDKRKSKLHKNIFKINKTNKKSVSCSYNDFELNSFNYKNSLLYDKRTCFKYYLSLLKTKNLIFFCLCFVKDYNSRIIKLCIFSLSFSIYYAINYSFFTEKIIHKIYETGGKYDILYFLPKISISFAISYAITSLIKYIFLSERNIFAVRKQKTYELANDAFFKEKRNLYIKYSFFFILGIIFLTFFWMLLSSFGAVYQNTQIFIFKNTIISFSFSLIYPFFISIFPSIFRISSLNSKTKNNECMFKFSKFLQIL